MSDVAISTIGGLVAFLFWGISDWLAARNSKKYSSYDVNLALRPASLIVGVALLIASYQQISLLSSLWPIVLVGLLFSAAYIFMMKATTTGHVGVVIPLISINPLITVALAIIFTGRILTWEQLVSILIIMSGVLLLAYRRNPKRIPVKELHRETILALIAAAFWGLGFFVLDAKVGGLAWQIVYGTLSLTMFVLALIMAFTQSKISISQKMKQVSKNGEGLLSGLALMIGSLAFFYSAGRLASILILVVISASAPLVASFLSAVYDHESLVYIKRFAAVLVVGGIVLLNLL